MQRVLAYLVFELPRQSPSPRVEPHDQWRFFQFDLFGKSICKIQSSVPIPEAGR